MKTIFKGKSLYDYPHLIAILIVALFGCTLGIGTGVIVAAWYCKCNSQPYSRSPNQAGVLGELKKVLAKSEGRNDGT
jgi:hypothetical protein